MVVDVMGIRQVAARLRVSTIRVRQLDLSLKPERDERGHRRYDPAAVERVAQDRAAAADRAAELVARMGFVREDIAAARLGVDPHELEGFDLPSVPLGDGSRAFRSDAVERLAGERAAGRSLGARP